MRSSVACSTRSSQATTCVCRTTWQVFLKQLKYVREGPVSDPPGMDMYVVVGVHPKTRLLMLRTLRNSSDREGHFLHYSRAIHPTAKGSKWPILHCEATGEILPRR